jgi:hypothetical protein
LGVGRFGNDETITPKKGMTYIEELNPYTGEVSIIALLENQKNGLNTFPHNIVNTTVETLNYARNNGTARKPGSSRGKLRQRQR